MLQYIDTHIHLDGEEFAADCDEVVARAKVSGVQKMLLPGINLLSVASIGDVCLHYPDFLNTFSSHYLLSFELSGDCNNRSL